MARAVERQRSGRSGIYDVTVTREEGNVIAEFRGHSRTIEGELAGRREDRLRRREATMVDRNYKPYGLEPIETASRDEIAALQTQRLKWSLQHVYDNVPAYKKKFDAAGVTPSDFKRIEDLAKFPFTTKHDLRDNYPFGLFAVPQDKIARIHASSGTTGKPTVVGYTKKDIDTWSGLMARSIRASGGRPGMKVHISYGYGLFTGGLGAHYGAEALGCTVIPVSGGMTERQVQLITDFKPDIIMVTPSYMLAILDEFRAKGLDPRAIVAARSGFSAPSPGPIPCARKSKRRSASTRSISTACRK